MNNIKAAITAVSAAVPDYVLTNKELEDLVDTSDKWITTRTGIKERRILKGKEAGTSVLGAQAVNRLLEKRGIKAEEIDLLICATVTPDMQFPATANIISDAVGAINAFSYDINAACSGFIYTLFTAAQFIETGRYKKVVIVGAEKMSSIVDYTDRATCILFGDAAGAVLLEPDSEGYGILDAELKADGSGVRFLHMKAGGSRKPASHETIDAKEHYVYQEGKSVFKFAVTGMVDSANTVVARNNMTIEDVNWLVPHQANLRIIDATSNLLGIDKEKVMINIEKYGNTTSATIPLCLRDYEKQMKKGDNIILAAFGGGFTWGSVYLKWAYNTP